MQTQIDNNDNIKGTITILCHVSGYDINGNIKQMTLEGNASISKYDYSLRKAKEAAKKDCIYQFLYNGGKSGPIVDVLDYFVNYVGDVKRNEFVKDKNGLYRKKTKKVDGLIKVKRESHKIKYRRIRVNGKYKIKVFVIIEGRENVLQIIDYNRGDLSKLRKKKGNSYINVARDVRTNIPIKANRWTYLKSEY